MMARGGTGDVAQWLQSEFKSEDPGFDPLAGQDEVQFFCPSESTLVQACLCLAPFVCTAHTQICAHVRDPFLFGA